MHAVVGNAGHGGPVIVVGRAVPLPVPALLAPPAGTSVVVSSSAVEHPKKCKYYYIPQKRIIFV